LADIHRRAEQVIEGVSQNQVLVAAWSDEQARTIMASFEQFLKEHRDEIITSARPY
jgi:hypothetical protein